MSDIPPDDPAFYASPHADETLIAIGRFITAWAGIETALPMQVARLIAGQDPSAPGTFAHAPFLWAASALMGTSAKAALTQIQNLCSGRKEDLKKASGEILKIKPFRDAVAHSLSGTVEDGTTRFHGFGASRAKMGTDKIYTDKQMDEWSRALIFNARTIDEIVTEHIGWSWKDIETDRERWRASFPEGEVKTLDISRH